MKVRNLLAYCLYYNRDHRGRLFDVRLAAGPAVNSLPGFLFVRMAVWGSLMLLSGYFTWHSWTLATRSGLPTALERRWTSVGFFVLMTCIGLAGFITGLPRARRCRSESLAAEGRCGACGYDLKAAAAEPDGCRVCPECGSAWRR